MQGWPSGIYISTSPSQSLGSSEKSHNLMGGFLARTGGTESAPSQSRTAVIPQFPSRHSTRILRGARSNGRGRSRYHSPTPEVEGIPFPLQFRLFEPKALRYRGQWSDFGHTLSTLRTG